MFLTSLRRLCSVHLSMAAVQPLGHNVNPPAGNAILVAVRDRGALRYTILYAVANDDNLPAGMRKVSAQPDGAKPFNLPRAATARYAGTVGELIQPNVVDAYYQDIWRTPVDLLPKRPAGSPSMRFDAAQVCMPGSSSNLIPMVP